MKVLFQTYSLAHQNPGGGERVISHLYRELNDLGVAVTLRDPWKHNPQDFTLIHYFSTLESSHWSFWKKHYPKIPVVVTPTLYLGENLSFLSRAREKVGAAFSIHENRRWKDLPKVDHLFPTTVEERDAIHRYFEFPKEKMTVLENGISSLFGTVNETEFREFSKINGDFVLHVGRFHPVKRQDFLIQALQDSNLTVVFIGNPDSDDQGYFERLKMLAQKSPKAKFIFFTGLNSDSTLLASAYAAAKVFALPSQFETFGLAALEAKVSGCSLVLSEGMVAKRLFSQARFLPLEDRRWKTAVESLMRQDRPERRTTDNPYSWKGIAQRLKQQYELVAAGKS